MSSERTTHLTDEELHDVLLGMGAPEVEAHAAECAECRGKVEAFRATMRDFNAATMAWSEARPVRRAIRTQQRVRVAVVSAGWALAAALLLAVGLTSWNRYETQGQMAEQPSAQTAPQAEDTEAQIAEDNELLRSVSAALSTADESPVAEYHLTGGARVPMKATPELRKP